MTDSLNLSFLTLLEVHFFGLSGVYSMFEFSNLALKSKYFKNLLCSEMHRKYVNFDVK